MNTRNHTVAISVREEVKRHRRKILNLNEVSNKLASEHRYRDATLIRLALLRQIQADKQLTQI